VADSWLTFTLIEGARFTVAGQWRSFTALPEHSIAVQSEFEHCLQGDSAVKPNLSVPTVAAEVKNLPDLKGRRALCSFCQGKNTLKRRFSNARHYDF
jgi:hypothetical protein